MYISVNNRVLVTKYLNYLTFIILLDEPILGDNMPLLYLLGIFNTSLTTIQRAQIEYTVDYWLSEPPFFKCCHLQSDLTIGLRKSQKRDNIN